MEASSILPTLVRPNWWGLCNRWRAKQSVSPVRDLALLAFSVLVMLSMYEGCVEMLRAIEQQARFASVPAGLPLGLLFMFLSFMLVLSNCVGALSAFYFGSDMALLLSSPISPRRFFFGRFITLYASSSWMPLVFGLPVVLAFGVHQSAGPAYYLISLVLLGIYFALATALGILLMTLLMRAIPTRYAKEIMSALVLSGIVILTLCLKSLFDSGTALHNTNDILRIIKLLSAPLTDWTPSYWASKVLELSLEKRYVEALPYFTASLGLLIFLSSLAFAAHLALHQKSFSRAKSMHRAGTVRSSRYGIISRLVLLICPRQLWAIIFKEYRLFFRDMTQAVQLLILLGLCIIYLYNFRVLNAVRGLPDVTRAWWQSVLVVINIGMGGFVMTAVCTRFVFPCISLEGKAFWLMQTAPIDIRDVLRAKFWAWFPPVATISSVIFASGALAIDTEPHIVVIHALVSWILCYGIVGLAIGLGAIFANFTWEHSTQLAASLGSLVYMLSSAIFILLNLIPAGILISLRTVRNLGTDFSDFDWYACVISCTLLITYFNYSAMRWGINAGTAALKARAKN